MKRIILFTIAIFGFTIHPKSQIVFEERVEIPLNDGYADETVLPLGVNGLIIQSIGKTGNGNKEYNFKLLNNQLQMVGEKSVPIKYKFSNVESTSNEDRVHVFEYTFSGDVRLITVEKGNLETKEVSFLVPKKFILGGAVGYENRYYGAMTKKKIPYMFSIDWESGELKTIRPVTEGQKPRYIKVVGVEKVSGSNEVCFIIKQVNPNYSTQLWLYFADDEGTLTRAINLGENIPEYLINGSVSCVGPNHYISTGTYSLRQEGMSVGLFFASIEGGKLKFMKLYNFLDLDNFLKYLPEGKEERIQQKKERKEAAGKELTINYFLAPHKVIPTGDGYIYIAEAYYPTYRTEKTVLAGGGYSYRSVFDGYQYTHGTIVKFDLEGNIVWDQVFELWPAYKPFVVKKFVSIPETSGETVELLYASLGRIHFKALDYNGNVVEDQDAEVINTGIEGDKEKWTSSEMVWWYDKNFLAYGDQKIKNKALNDEDRKRKVFFVNKIRYDVQGK